MKKRIIGENVGGYYVTAQGKMQIFMDSFGSCAVVLVVFALCKQTLITISNAVLFCYSARFGFPKVFNEKF